MENIRICEKEIKKNKNEDLLELDNYRRSPMPIAGASRPKKCYTTPSGEIYFKFGLTNNELCAEMFAFSIGIQLGISIAKTRLAVSSDELGIASYDIGEYTEPDDRISYSIKDFIHLKGFTEMCLFDYLIMNEDRHAINWGISDKKVAPLYDHNYCFGGPTPIVDISHFMKIVTSAFYVNNEYAQNYDTLLKYFVKYHKQEVYKFLEELKHIKTISINALTKRMPDDCHRLNKFIIERKQYMIRKVGEYSARQINDNEF